MNDSVRRYYVISGQGKGLIGDRETYEVIGAEDSDWTVILATDYDQLAARLAASEAEVAGLRAKLAKLAEYASHKFGCGLGYSATAGQLVSGYSCTCGLAALQSSEKGL